MDSSEDEAPDSNDLFVEYVPNKGLGGSRKHPTAVCESASLAFIPSPEPKYRLHLPKSALKKMSNLQVETVMLACEKHLEFLPSGARCGFYIGDSTGVGKGRMIAAIILHNIYGGREKAIWLSASAMLRQSAEEDLTLLGFEGNVLNVESLDPEENGVLFLTYQTLGSAGAMHKSGGSKPKVSRFEEICHWMGENFDGLIAFDECHRAKQFSSSEAECTTTAKLVVKLQLMYPKARILYCSATAAWQADHLAYLQRLGLFGNTTFPDAECFIEAMKQRKMDGMELLAMELKLNGFYVARQLSLKGIQYQCQTVEKLSDFVRLYDDSAHLWRTMHKFLKDSDLGPRKTILGRFWSSNQKFFCIMCIAAKIPAAIQETRLGVQSGMAAVICLQSTGEESYTRLEENRKAAGNSMYSPAPFSLCRSILKDTIEKVLKIDLQTDSSSSGAEDSDDDSLANSSTSDNESSDSSDSEDLESVCKKKRTDLDPLVQSIKQQYEELSSRLPPNPLDSLIQGLGGPDHVCEVRWNTGVEQLKSYSSIVANTTEQLTGRTHRELSTSNGYISETRGVNPNISEQEAFRKNQRSIVVISDAASTGISLHDDKEYSKKERRRLHITLELPWSADKAIQQLGRTHRSNQNSAPKYLLLVSPVPAELRFTTGIAARLQSLGALTHGDRRIGKNASLAAYELNPKYSTGTLRNLLKFLCGGDSVLFQPEYPQDVKDQLQLAGVISNGKPTRGCYNSNKFFNRLLLLNISAQEIIMKLFWSTFEYYVQRKTFGPIVDCVQDLTPAKSEAIPTVKSEELKFVIHCGIVFIHIVTIDNGVTWARALNMISGLTPNNFLFVKKYNGLHFHVILAIREGSGFKEFSPSTGQRIRLRRATLQEVKKDGEILSLEAAKTLWIKQLIRYSEIGCVHAYRSGKCRLKNCTLQSRVTKHHIVSGCLTQIWDQVKQSNEHRENRLVRCTLSNRKKLIGIKIESTSCRSLMLQLKKMKPESNQTKSRDVEEIARLRLFDETSEDSSSDSDSSDSSQDLSPESDQDSE